MHTHFDPEWSGPDSFLRLAALRKPLDRINELHERQQYRELMRTHEVVLTPLPTHKYGKRSLIQHDDFQDTVPVIRTIVRKNPRKTQPRDSFQTNAFLLGLFFFLVAVLLNLH
jgi:hypothetical protein